MLNVKQKGIKYHMLSLLYDSTWYLTLVSLNTGEHSTHYTNGPVCVYMYIHTGPLV